MFLLVLGFAPIRRQAYLIAVAIYSGFPQNSLHEELEQVGRIALSEYSATEHFSTFKMTMIMQIICVILKLE